MFVLNVSLAYVHTLHCSINTILALLSYILHCSSIETGAVCIVIHVCVHAY